MNLPTIYQHGILCHNLMQGRPHRSIASSEVQDRRTGKSVPGGLELHDYANLYFDARNPMMYLVRRVWNVHDVVVVRVAHEVLDLPGVVVTDGNAASHTTEFHDPVMELHLLDKGRIFAISWNVADEFDKAERKRQRCSEVLVPGAVSPTMLRGLFVEAGVQAEVCRAAFPGWAVEVRPDVFFR
jgi:ssDNA thymidine ADP-ribosyltransferase, DarT